MNRRSMMFAVLGVSTAGLFGALPAPALAETLSDPSLTDVSAVAKKRRKPRRVVRQPNRGQTAPRDPGTTTPGEKAPVNR